MDTKYYYEYLVKQKFSDLKITIEENLEKLVAHCIPSINQNSIEI